MLSILDNMDVAPDPQKASPELKKTTKGPRSPDHIFTLGIEEEFQIIDPETRELRSHIQQILADGKMILEEQIKPELHQSVVELGTEICDDAREARQQIAASSQLNWQNWQRSTGSGNRVSRHASVFSLDGSIDHRQRAICHRRK